MHLIIDADPIVYRSGFAAESVTYQAIIQDDQGNILDRHFIPQDDKTAYKAMQDYLDEVRGELLHSEKLVNVEPVSHALMIVKQSMESITAEVGHPMKPYNSPTLHVLLSGPGNYRERIATYKPYKGNRDPEHKPVHYQAIRDYLTDKWGAVVVHGHEADDEASILASSFRRKRVPYVVASIDKDLHQIPGKHYDYRIKQLVTIQESDARAMLWRQVLSGDPTDNIPGACKIGAVKAQKLVDTWLSDEFSDSELWHAVVGVYRQAAGTKGCYYHEQDAQKAALENMRLVYLQREPNELWVPPGYDPEYVEVGIDD